MHISFNKKFIKVVLFTSLLSTKIFASNSYAEIKKFNVEDKEGYSRITIYLDKDRKYRMLERRESGVVLEIESIFSEALPGTGQKSKIVRSIENYEVEQGKSRVAINLAERLSAVSSFFVKSPPRIVVNIKVKEGGNPVDEKKERVIKEKSKGKERLPLKNLPKSAKSTPIKKDVDSPFTHLEGYEDIITPPLDEFVEIFDTEKALSVYHISLPPDDSLKDFPDIYGKRGNYDLKNTYFKKIGESIDNGNYKEALEMLEKASPEITKKDSFAFLMADATFQKALVEGGLSDAINSYIKLIATRPKSMHIPWAFMQIGRGRLKLKSYNGAAEAFKMVISKFGDSFYAMDAKLNLARTVSGQGDRERALHMYKDYIKKYPSSPFLAKAVFGAAENMVHLGRYRKAASLFEKGLQRWPDYPSRDPEILMVIGESFYHTKNFESAAEYFNKVVKLYPKFSQGDKAMGRVGDIYYHLGNKKDAEKVYSSIEEKYPGSDGALIGMIRRADILDSNGGNIKKVMKLYQKVYEKYTENRLAEVATLKAGLFLARRGKHMQAFELYRNFMVMYPKSKLTQTVIDEILKIFPPLLVKNYEKGDCVEVIRLVKNNPKLIPLVKKKNKPFLMVGNCYSRYGQYNEAADMYEKIKDGSELEEARFMLGKTRYLGGEIESSIKVIESFGRNFPKSKRGRELIYLLAKAYKKRGNLERSANFYRLYLEKEKNRELRANALMELGGILRKAGYFSHAVEVYNEGVRSYLPEDSRSLSRAYFLLGETLFDEKLFEKALDVFKLAKNHSNEKLFNEIDYKIALCLERLGEEDEAEAVLGKIQGASDEPFWRNISVAKVEDMRWQASHD